jgi:hypothetical protein
MFDARCLTAINHQAACCASKNAIGKDARTQAAAALQPIFGSRTEGGVHPITGFAFLDAGKAHAMKLKFSANQLI